MSLVGWLWIVDGQADVWVVPDEFVTIQSAVDFSANDDTILVRPGTYFENILLLGKSLRIASLAGPATTIIDGSAPTRPDTESVFCAIGPLEIDLEGFTIRNALGGTTIGQGSPGNSGAGLALYSVDGSITNCVVERNFCGGSGGGIHLFVSSPRIADCIVRENECFGNGGGIDIYVCSPTIERCVVTDNGTESTWLGGGIGIYFGSPVIRDCEVSRNQGRAACGIGAGGTSNPVIERVLIADNNPLGDLEVGSAVGVGSGRIENCTIVGNTAATGVSLSSNAVMTRSIVAFNSSQWAVACSGNARIGCCDLFGNEGGDELCGEDLGNNFSLDPMLCEDFRLAESSPCAPGQSPGGCDLIGALPVGCADAIEASTWGGIKVRYSR
jgi:hypothetical protein